MQELVLVGSALTAAVNLFTYIIRTYVFPRWGKTGVQCIVASLALIAALYITFESRIPGIRVFLVSFIGIFSMAVSLYEVLWSKLKVPEALK